ncbi:MAG: ribulokinase [Rhizobium sp.]|nr:ribulokinase [Rhizobium sp.]
MGEFVVAVDVGTGSARAGVFDRKGTLFARASRPIAMNREDGVTAEHSSADIWSAVAHSVREAVATAGIDPALVDAIGFDATCSLTFLDDDGRPLSTAKSGEAGWDTIAWLDHRAIAEAVMLSRSKADALRYSGNLLSPEMALPKIVWVRDHLPEIWAKTGKILDLADFLTWRATGSLARSACTLTAKWNYLNHGKPGWDTALLSDSGLADLPEKANVPGTPLVSGTAVGTLSPETAAAFGLPQTCRVAAGMVDAYAGALALTGADPDAAESVSLIGGTSSCVMRLTIEPQFLHSFWGPYFGAALPGYWIIEGGQSAAGSLLDYILRTHLGRDPNADDHEKVLTRIALLLDSQGAAFGRRIHVLPDFHGNRTPFGDASMLGSIHGLSLDSSFDGLAALYYRTMVALVLGMRQTIDKMEETGTPIRMLYLGGGHAKSPLFAQLYADATGRDVVISSGEEAMLLGTAMTAASAAGWYASLLEASRVMRRSEKAIRPNPANVSAFERDYRIFLRMQQQRQELAALS